MIDNKEFKILVVDDNQKNVQVLGTLLKNERYNIIVAQNGLEAIERATKIHPDLVLLDINMPGLDGLQVCEKLKSLEKVKDIPIIFLTAQDTTVDKVKGFSIGAADYIAKPYDPPELLARVATHLEIRSSRMQLAKDEKLRATLKAHGILAHEVYNPLTSVLGNIDMIFLMMEKNEFNEEKLNLYLTRASEGCHSIFEKVEQLKQLKDQDIDEIHDGLRFKKTS